MASDVIKSRQDFYRILDETIRMVGDRIRKTPKFRPYEDIEFQLDEMWRWTRDDRTPTDDERQQIDIGLIALRELEAMKETDDDQDFVTNLHELNYYWDNWPDDPNVEAQT